MYTDKKEGQMSLSAERPDLETVGGRLRAVRKARGLFLASTATKIGLSRTSLHQWESGAVQRLDKEKLGTFVKLVDVSLDWLLERKGEEPDLTPPSRRRRRSKEEPTPIAIPSGVVNSVEHFIPEVAAALSAHAKQIDMTPRALWAIPHQVLEIGFNAEPGSTVVKRVAVQSHASFGLSRGDYVLIDTSRTRIDEAGTYLVADPAGLSAHRVLIIDNNGTLEVSSVADDLQRSFPQPTVDNLIPLGRVMGILKPV